MSTKETISQISNRKFRTAKLALGALALAGGLTAGTIFESQHTADPTQAAESSSAPTQLFFPRVYNEYRIPGPNEEIVSSNDTETRLIFNSKTKTFSQDELRTPYTKQFTIYIESPATGKFHLEGRGCAIAAAGDAYYSPDIYAPSDVELTAPVQGSPDPSGYRIDCLGGFNNAPAHPNIPTDYTDGVTLTPVK
ncbi:MAG: hypothetical protein M1277_01640 [Patescibacteria group bacterium]|nr:hypothetical protein [Patescibacteria group bacterium]